MIGKDMYVKAGGRGERCPVAGANQMPNLRDSSTKKA